MMLIPTYVAPSRIEGVGVFAAEDIPAGTLIWRLDPTLDRLLSKDDIAALSEVHQAFVERYGYPYPHDRSMMIVELDNGRFMNHSTVPNTSFSNPDAGFTRVAIAAHEELICDYSEFDPSFEILPGRLFVSVT
ncbi:MAG: protein-lysine N-methyltransferase [Alphaproteobacteria bacterium]|jgi:SET domain-containing protein|nr:protein-lysine N-methyltransferase [Alphaproteobacteria bacterium]